MQIHAKSVWLGQPVLPKLVRAQDKAQDGSWSIWRGKSEALAPAMVRVAVRAITAFILIVKCEKRIDTIYNRLGLVCREKVTE